MSIFDKWRDGDMGTGDYTKHGKGDCICPPKSWDPKCPRHPATMTGTGTKLPPLKPLKTCTHTGTVASFTLERTKPSRRGTDTVQIYGARGSSLMTPGADLSHLDLIIDMSGLVKRPKPFAKSGSWRGRDLNVAAFPEVLALDWPDMSAPTQVPAKFWVKLLAALPAHVCISCVGSHGRTGTAMACLLVASGMSAEKAIAKVRHDHCEHAIETQGQVAYIKRIAAALGH